MAEDNTPTVTARRRKATRQMRLRLETVKKIRAMGAKRKSKKDHEEGAKVTVHAESNGAEADHTGIVKTRAPKVKKATLAEPPVAKSQVPQTPGAQVLAADTHVPYQASAHDSTERASVAIRHSDDTYCEKL